MRELGPTFIDITWGAGGTRAETTAQFVKAAHEEFGLETCMHLTCTDMARDKIEKALDVSTFAGCMDSSDPSCELTLFCLSPGRLRVWLPQHPRAPRRSA